MKVVVIGAVAAGTKAAAKIKRCDAQAQVKIITKSEDISYAGCGLPYYVSGVISSKEELIVNTPQKYSGLTGVSVDTGCEVTAVDTDKKLVSVRALDGRQYTESYDKLVIASGAEPFVPDVPGKNLKGVFTVRQPEDVVNMRRYIQRENCKRAVVCGGGFIGLEMAENLHALGLDVTVVDMARQIMPGLFDSDMAGYIKRKLKDSGIKVLTQTALQTVDGEEKVSAVVTGAGRLSADIAVMALGIRPSTGFLAGSGIEIVKGAVKVDENMRTNVADVYAAGDCALVYNSLTKAEQWSAMGSTANITARVLAQNLCGGYVRYGGCLGTGVAKLLANLNCGRTGLTHEQALKAGYNAVSVVCVTDDKAHYYTGAASFVTKLTADADSGRLLGIQVIGAGAVDKMVDIAVVGISQAMKVSDFDTLDFAYAPPFSTAIHPFVTACYVLENKMSGEFETISPEEYAATGAKDYKVVDVQAEATIPGASWADLDRPQTMENNFAKDEKILLVCTKGKRAYMMQKKLKALGYTNTKVLEGGVTFNTVKVQRTGTKLPAEEIKRVKGLGCLQDKRYDDVFNVRVITRNGKLTSAEQQAVAEAAEKFGSGEVTMTTRLTLEIQGVKYDRLEELFRFLEQSGLETGGTGSKVRPVVSCKGTTCQYGLIDTFDLSEKLHNLFYKGYHEVALPHKFKIAVGGCPNNCVKPDLNDLGIVGRRVPAIIADKCRNCKVCQVENACPIHVAKVKDGVIDIDRRQCNNCGRCLNKCPFGAMEEMMSGYKVYIGGRWGKKVAGGQMLDKIFTSKQEVIDLVEKAILFFRDEGISGERFSDTINRLGFDYVQDKLLNSQLDKSKIMEKEVVGGATC